VRGACLLTLLSTLACGRSSAATPIPTSPPQTEYTDYYPDNPMVHQVGKLVVGGDGEPSGQAPQARMAAFASMAILHAKPGPIGDGMPRTANKAGGAELGAGAARIGRYSDG
jgi:hypothetical protein